MLLAASFGGFMGFHVLLPVVPAYATQTAGSGSVEAGITTTALLLTTVLTQVQVPRILDWMGYRGSFVVGLALMGLPAFFYSFAGNLAGILAVTLLRGVGFGIVTVVAGALIAELVVNERRGEGIGLFGLAGGLPTVFGLPLGPWLADHAGYPAVFSLGAAFPLLGIVAALGLRVPSPERGERRDGFFSALKRPELLRLCLLFCVPTAVFGAIVTFLPLAANDSGLGSAAAALLVAGVASTVSRWQGGKLGDRYGARALLGPALVLAALGVVFLGFADGAVLLLCGAALFGLGFGAVQNATMVLMVERVYREEYGLASTLWNVAFDAGTGIGGLVFGIAIEVVGFAGAFGLGGVFLLAVLPLAFDRPKLKGG